MEHSNANTNHSHAAKQSEADQDFNKQSQTISSHTMGSAIGEIVWLLSQSPLHSKLQIGDLQWLVYPPVVLQQFKIFRDAAQKPIGVVFWGYLNEQSEAKLRNLGKLAPEDWGNNAKIDAEKGLLVQEGGQLWLVEMVIPFHTDENKHQQQVLADLINTNFKKKSFKLMQLNPATRKREEICVNSNGRAV